MQKYYAFVWELRLRAHDIFAYVHIRFVVGQTSRYQKKKNKLNL